MTSTHQPRSRPGGGDPASRGLILVGVAVVLGLIILIKGGGVGYEHSTKSVDVPDNGAVTTTTAAPTTTVATVAPADVPVVVANGSGQTGLAKTVANNLKTAGFTNTTPTVPYRGAGRPEATAAAERAMDLFAAEIGKDAAEVVEAARQVLQAWDIELNLPKRIQSALRVLDDAMARYQKIPF